MMNVLHEILLTTTEKFPDKISLYHQEMTITYEEILRKSINLQKIFIETAVKKGDRIAVYLDKRIEKVVSIFGIWMSGGILVPIRPLLIPQQVHYILEDSEATVLITTQSRLISLNLDEKKLSSLRLIILLDNDNQVPSIGGIKIVLWKKLIEEQNLVYTDIQMTGRDIAAILYTSGSTGFPKGVVLSHHNILKGTQVVSEYLRLVPDERILSILTFSFDYGLNQLLTAFYVSAQLVLINHLFTKDIINAVRKFEVTGLAAVATTWIQLLQLSWNSENIPSLRYITNSGGSIPPRFVKELQNRLPKTRIYLMYGLTEAFRSTYLDPMLIDRYPNSIGKAVPGEEILVLDENDQPVTSGQVGELVHKGELVAQGYWKNPIATANRFKPNPFSPPGVIRPDMVVYSGDFVEIDEDGFLYFIGRKDEMIKSAGNRISPTEVEEIMYRSGMVGDVVAFGIPDEILGQAVCIVTSLVNKEESDIEKIRRFCHTSMPPYMVPKHIEVWNLLPSSGNGKLDRESIRKTVFNKLMLKIPNTITK